MKNENSSKGFLLIVSMIFIASFSRLIPHAPNFTAVGAIALFGSAYFSRKYLVILAPIVAMFLTDIFINNVVYASYNDGFVIFQSFQLYTYSALILVSILGIYLLEKVSISKIITGSVLASVIFFLITNFGAWMSPFAIFPHTFAGLIETYIAGLPFALNSVVSNLFFATILFGAYHFITKQFPSLASKKNNSAILS